ncbi:hypothetical protein ND748_31170, partial [Frankia sp. AiPs1]|uniref:WXG100 family type VII secretion target n=1 Tax=Frankia sp. AiPs1 TaxID=573493 RepID=UPI00204400FF
RRSATRQPPRGATAPGRRVASDEPAASTRGKRKAVGDFHQPVVIGTMVRAPAKSADASGWVPGERGAPQDAAREDRPETRGEQPMAGSFEVDHAIMSRSASGGSNIALDVKATSDAMIAQLDGLIWQGEGKIAFDDAKDALRDDLQSISNALQNLSGMLGQASGFYGTVDVDARDVVRRAGVGAGGIAAGLRGLA